jgi:hypothetical protein
MQKAFLHMMLILPFFFFFWSHLEVGAWRWMYMQRRHSQASRCYARCVDYALVLPRSSGGIVFPKKMFCLHLLGFVVKMLRFLCHCCIIPFSGVRFRSDIYSPDGSTAAFQGLAMDGCTLVRRRKVDAVGGVHYMVVDWAA